ncbi:hypothetical protein HMI54_011888 [Coelomomyces lativittatus]|nr:hypothetical protein HMI54_011888 [Coelomomyces lativittatus]
MKDLKNEETLYAEKTQARFIHLTELSTMKVLDSPEFVKWIGIRTNRLVLDYLFREGYLELSERMVKIHHLEDFADTEFFSQAKKIENSLKLKSCTECLAWCADNKTNLKKIKSNLEFNLRLQEFIELARSRQLSQCLDYAQTYLSNWAVDTTTMEHMQPVLGCIAFHPSTYCEPYHGLYAVHRWDALVIQFRHDNFLIHSLPPVSSFELTLQAGLSALKTVNCLQTSCNKGHSNCPVCSDPFKILAEKLPLGHHVNSSYVCYISGDVMDENNPPMVTPEGYVYSLKAVQEMASQCNGEFKCPRTQASFPLKKLKKMYLT